MTYPRTLEMDDQLNVRLPSAMRRELEAAAKRERRRVTDLGRIIWEDWLAGHAEHSRENGRLPDDRSKVSRSIFRRSAGVDLPI